MTMNRTVTLSKHEMVIDRDVFDAIVEIAHGADAADRDFSTEETLQVLKSYAAKAHKHDSLCGYMGIEIKDDYDE